MECSGRAILQSRGRTERERIGRWVGNAVGDSLHYQGHQDRGRALGKCFRTGPTWVPSANSEAVHLQSSSDLHSLYLTAEAIVREVGRD